VKPTTHTKKPTPSSLLSYRAPHDGSASHLAAAVAKLEGDPFES
jgi:hypothetical protein